MYAIEASYSRLDEMTETYLVSIFDGVSIPDIAPTMTFDTETDARFYIENTLDKNKWDKNYSFYPVKI